MIQSAGGIILCGGQSRRMGISKADLPFGPRSMLAHMLDLVRSIPMIGPIAVVAAAQQALPPLPDDILVGRDREPGRGPLEGLVVGLQSLMDQAEVALVVSCDVPLLRPAVAARILEAADNHDAVVPVQEGQPHPLLAAYRTRLWADADQLLMAEKRRLSALLDSIATCYMDSSELRDVDDDLRSFLNVNDPEQYQHAIRLAGVKLSGDAALQRILEKEGQV